MAKIYGKSVFIPEKGKLHCEICGYNWNPSPVEKDKILKGLKITCPFCRVTRGKKPGQILNDENTTKFVLSVTNSAMSITELASLIKNPTNRSIRQIEVIDLTNKRVISLTYYEYINLLKYPSFSIDTPVNYNLAEPDIAKNSENYVSKVKRVIKPLDDKTLENTIRAGSIDYALPRGNVVIKKSNEQINIEKPDITDKKQDKAKDWKQRAYDVLKSNVNGIYKDSVKILGVDTDKGEYTIQCVHCGFKETKSISSFKNKSKMQSALSCSRCSSGKHESLSEKIDRYVGKIYNGLRITNIYTDNKGYTRCDVDCVESIDFRKNNETNEIEYVAAHKQTNLQLGDVINGRCCCKDCEKHAIVSSRRLVKNINCRYILDKLGYNSVNSKYSLGRNYMTIADFYKLNGSICSICDRNKNCHNAFSEEMSTSWIKQMADQQDSVRQSVNEVMANYPNIYDGKASTGKFELNVEKGLILFRDAYRSREGKLYKFCKCLEHGTEMILSEDEISEFNHCQCISNKSPYMRFYALDKIYLMI